MINNKLGQGIRKGLGFRKKSVRLVRKIRKHLENSYSPGETTK